ncbi:hypothetical protein CEXT_392291 [Caerostris extrusa]|uniref:Uncharacterized protein n=1 Tax=Caerostris extrusa TaxID=172846 RepID=A0AAV4Y333_CAEEX|nr:hypothetical protein CEXT_392291 [Caerostris extrusa]
MLRKLLFLKKKIKRGKSEEEKHLTGLVIKLIEPKRRERERMKLRHIHECPSPRFFPQWERPKHNRCICPKRKREAVHSVVVPSSGRDLPRRSAGSRVWCRRHNGKWIHLSPISLRVSELMSHAQVCHRNRADERSQITAG